MSLLPGRAREVLLVVHMIARGQSRRKMTCNACQNIAMTNQQRDMRKFNYHFEFILAVETDVKEKHDCMSNIKDEGVNH